MTMRFLFKETVIIDIIIEYHVHLSTGCDANTKFSSENIVYPCEILRFS